MNTITANVLFVIHSILDHNSSMRRQWSLHRKAGSGRWGDEEHKEGHIRRNGTTLYRIALYAKHDVIILAKKTNRENETVRFVLHTKRTIVIRVVFIPSELFDSLALRL